MPSTFICPVCFSRYEVPKGHRLQISTSPDGACLEHNVVELERRRAD
jgi:hypothetical protein